MIRLYWDNRYIYFGILGAIISLYGNFQYTSQSYYIIGSLILLCTALHYKLVYFIALELILGAGHLAAYLGLGPYILLALPMLLCLQLLIFYLMVGHENSFFLFVGIIGIGSLSLGFSYDRQLIFFIGSLFISIYAYYLAYKVNKASYIWAVLNSFFMMIALYKLIVY